MGITEKLGEEPTYQWEKDCDFDLILEFEKEIQRRNMLETWPFPGYKWQGLGTYDFFVEDLIDEGDGPSLPKFPKHLQHCWERLIWYRYSVSYPALLVDQINQMLLSTPTSTLDQPLVSLDCYENAWKELRLTLKDYLRVHFTERPQSCSFETLENKCADIIEAVANQVQKRLRNRIVIMSEVRKAANLVSQFHEENTVELLKKDGMYDDTFMSSVTMRRVDSSTFDSSRSKINTEEADKKAMRVKEEAKKKKIAKQQSDRRRAEQKAQDEKRFEQQK